jgi:hypothetical protein
MLCVIHYSPPGQNGSQFPILAAFRDLIDRVEGILEGWTGDDDEPQTSDEEVCKCSKSAFKFKGQ